METIKVNSIFISDTHLGFAYSRPDRLVAFLKRYSCKSLYLVGDIFELWFFPEKFRLTQGVVDFFSEVIRMKQEGCHITYIPGNHDEFFKKYTIPGVDIVEEAVHITAKYDTVLLIHGDIFDTVLQMRITPLVYKIGDFMYSLSIFLNNKINFFRKLFGFPYWSFSHYLKTKVKNAVAYLSDFESMIVQHAKDKRCDTIVAGHIHVAADKMIDGIRYMNCGSWIHGEGESYILEELDGTLRLWHKEEQ